MRNVHLRYIAERIIYSIVHTHTRTRTSASPYNNKRIKRIGFQIAVIIKYYRIRIGEHTHTHTHLNTGSRRRGDISVKSRIPIKRVPPVRLV